MGSRNYTVRGIGRELYPEPNAFEWAVGTVTVFAGIACLLAPFVVAATFASSLVFGWP